jgi:hypothetical protein
LSYLQTGKEEPKPIKSKAIKICPLCGSYELTAVFVSVFNPAAFQGKRLTDPSVSS